MKGNNKGFIIGYLKDVGLTSEESKIYTEISIQGPMTILEISRSTGIERTKTYRLTSKMMKEGLIEQIIDYKKKYYKAADIERIKQIVEEKKVNINTLSQGFHNFSNLLDIAKSQSHETRVQFYRGRNGLRQIFWNILKAEDTCCSYVYRLAHEAVGAKFFQRWVRESVNRGIKYNEIVSKEFYESQEDYKNNNQYNEVLLKGTVRKLLAKDVLKIEHQMDIYNDVVAIYNWHRGEPFGIEIYNKYIADMQRNMFNVFWEKAKFVKEY